MTPYTTPPPTGVLPTVHVDEVIVNPAVGYAPEPVELLHPNLARLAAIYDQIVEAHAVGRIDSTTASAEIRKLQARDDQGVVWAIRDDGRWYRKTRDGHLVPDTPPTTGIPAVSPFDVSPPNYRSQNPDYNLLNQGAVEVTANVSVGDSYTPRSRVALSSSPLRRFWNWKHKFVAITAAALFTAATLVGIAAYSAESAADAAPAAHPTATIIVEP